MVALQRTSSEMKLNPHVHAVFLDGHYVERAEEFTFEARSRVSTSEVAELLQRTRDKMFEYLRRNGLLALGRRGRRQRDGPAASAVAGTTPPAGPEGRRGKLPLTHQAMMAGRPLSVALDGFRLHAATRARAPRTTPGGGAPEVQPASSRSRTGARELATHSRSELRGSRGTQRR